MIDLSDELKVLLGIAETALTVATGSGEAQAGDGISAQTKMGLVKAGLSPTGEYGNAPVSKPVEANYATGASDSQVYQRKTTQKVDKNHPLYKIYKGTGKSDADIFKIIEKMK